MTPCAIPFCTCDASPAAGGARVRWQVPEQFGGDGTPREVYVCPAHRDKIRGAAVSAAQTAVAKMPAPVRGLLGAARALLDISEGGLK